MKFFIDTANLDQIREAQALGILDGVTLQDYPVSDMIFGPRQIVSMISREVTLLPGDVIACGTSLGASDLEPGQTIEIVIEEIGRLQNRYAG